MIHSVAKSSVGFFISSVPAAHTWVGRCYDCSEVGEAERTLVVYSGRGHSIISEGWYSNSGVAG